MGSLQMQLNEDETIDPEKFMNDLEFRSSVK